MQLTVERNLSNVFFLDDKENDEEEVMALSLSGARAGHALRCRHYEPQKGGPEGGHVAMSLVVEHSLQSLDGL